MAIPDPREILTRPARPPDLTVRYGVHPEHLVDIRLPVPGQRGPLLILIHGGFWRAAYDRRHTDPLAADLADRGYPVATVEFRRVGQDGGGWPGTFDDVSAAITAVPRLLAAASPAPDQPDSAESGHPAGSPAPGQPALDVARPILVGHSAGGHLALWYAAGAATALGGVLALAPVADLRTAYRLGLGDGAVAALLGGGPQEVPDRYAAADPMDRLPLRVPVVLVHGGDDDRVPLVVSQRYLAAALAAGDAPVLQALPGVDHFALIDPKSAAWSIVVDGLRRLVEMGRGVGSEHQSNGGH